MPDVESQTEEFYIEDLNEDEDEDGEDDISDSLPEAVEAELVPRWPHCYCNGEIFQEAVEIGCVTSLIAVSVMSVLFIPITIWHYMSKWFPDN